MIGWKWFQRAEARAVAIGYVRVLRQALATGTEGGWILCWCCDCSVPFLTAPTNRDRDDLRCAFGCRKNHDCRSSNARSIAYYQTIEGKLKKAEQNAKRQKVADKKPAEPPPPDLLPLPLIEYLRNVLSWLGHRKLSLAETEKIIKRALRRPEMRQRSLDFSYDLMHGP